MLEPDPCPDCPVRGLPCPASFEPRYCQLVAARPELYRSLILRRARALAGAVDRPPPPWAFADPVGVALLVADLGGASGCGWLPELMAYVDSGRVSWTGLALAPGGRLDPKLGRELAGLVRLHGGSEVAADGSASADRLIQRHADYRDAVREACLGAQLLIAVGIRTLGPQVSGLGLPIVLAATGRDATTRGSLAASENAATRLVATTPAAVAAFSAGRQAEITLIPTGVPAERCVPRIGRPRQRAAWGVDDRTRLIGLIAHCWPGESLRSAMGAAMALEEGARLVLWGRMPIGEKPGHQGLGNDGNADSQSGIIDATDAHLGDVLASVDVILAAPELGMEGFPPGLVEAWLAGVPVVVPPSEEVDVLERRHGPLTVRASRRVDPVDLAASLRQALGAETAPVVARARRLAWDFLTVGVMGERWTRLLVEVARPRSAASIVGGPIDGLVGGTT